MLLHHDLDNTTVYATPRRLTTKRVGDVQSFTHGCSGHYQVRLPGLTTSSLLGTSNGDQHYHHLFVDVYAKYDVAYQQVTDKINSILYADNLTNLRALLFRSIVNRGYGETMIEQRYREIVTLPGREFTADLFRYIATSCMITGELAKVDPEGKALHDSMHRMKQAYCDSLDLLPNVKEEIYNGIGLCPGLHQPCSLFVDDIVQWSKHPPTHPLAGLPNYEKPPVIHCCVEDTSSRSETKQTISTRIYDHTQTPITTPEEVNRFLYRKATTQTPFKLKQDIIIKKPAVYWSSLTKKGVFLLRVAKLVISAKIETRKTQHQEEHHASPLPLLLNQSLPMNLSLFFVAIILIPWVLSLLYSL